MKKLLHTTKAAKAATKAIVSLGIAIAIIALGITSCTVDTECRQQINVVVGVQLQGDSLRLNTDSTAYDTVSFTQIRGLSVCGVSRDSLLSDGQKSISSLSLPLRKTADTTAFAFSLAGIDDTLLVVYTREPNYISLACGCAIFSTIDTIDYTTRFIDSVEVLNTAVTTVKENHLKLYFHMPQENLPKANLQQ